MKRLALALRTASEDALCKASLEAMASDMSDTTVSMEQQIDDLSDMIHLAHGLDSVVVSVESFGEASLQQKIVARDQALSYLSLSGLTSFEAEDIFPSLEAEGQTSAWEKFKSFLANLWKYITEAAKKIYEFVRTLLKKSSLAEKAAMMKLRTLRMELRKQENGLTHEATIKLRPAHRYLFDAENKLENLEGLKRNVTQFEKGRDCVQKQLPQVISKVHKDMMAAVDNLNVTGTDEIVTASVEQNMTAMFEAVKPMFPEALARTLGANGQEIQLIYDRVLRINAPPVDRDSLITEEQVKAHLGEFGISVIQNTVAKFDTDAMGTFPALRIGELEQVLKLAEGLIDSGHSADQQRQWEQTERDIRKLATAVDVVIKEVLKRKELSSKARSGLKMVLNARHAMNRWATAPYMQINTVNIRVVDSLLSLVEDQIKNYETTDSMQEKADKQKEADLKAKADKTKSPKSAKDVKDK